MSGHEHCMEGVFFVEPPARFPPKSRESHHLEVESYKDKVIDDLTKTLKRYAGISERAIAGREPSCQGYCWTKDGRFSFMDNVGNVESANGPELALMKLREYNLIE